MLPPLHFGGQQLPCGIPVVVSQATLGPVEAPHEEFVFDAVVNALSI